MLEPAARRQMLQRLKERKLSLTGGAEEIPAREPGPAPLSFGQQRLWFIEQLEPGNPRFNILTAVRMKGRLWAGVLLEVFQEIVRRHEALRTTMTMLDGEPVQIVSPETGVQIPVLDLAELDGARQERHLHELVKVATTEPFDLEKGPLYQILLARLGGDHHVLFLTMHQIIVDRWSRGLLVQEIVTLYEAFCDGKPSPLPPLPVQYADYAVWQRGRLQGGALEKLFGYWRQQLDTPLPTLDLPTDRPRPAIQRPDGRMQYFLIPQPELDELKALGQREGVTLFMILLAGVTALFQRYTGQEDFVLGSPIANRTRKEIEGLIGFFLNMLALRVRPRPEGTFRELLRSAREVAIGAFDHQDMPFERLVDELGVERDLSRHPLFQVTLVLQNAPMPPLKLRDLTMGLLEVDWGTTAFDLALFFWETELWESMDKGLSLTTSCSKDLFEEGTITRMVGHLRNLLREVAAHPERGIRDLSLLADGERRQLLSAPARRVSEIPDMASIAERFEARVRQSPRDLAVDYPDGTLTYEELSGRANQLAHRLLDLGVRPSSPIGIVAESSWKTVAGLLGILKAGGACLPLSPEEAGPRRDLILADSGAPILLVQGFSAEVSCPPFVTKLRLESCWERVEPEGVRRPEGALGRNAPACLFYTSGSTGVPKGVWVAHEAVLRLVLDNGLLELGPGDRVAQASSVAFDASTFEIWGSLLTGATLVGIDRETLLSPYDLACVLKDKALTTLFLTTALFHQMSDTLPTAFAGLRHLLVGGETVDPEAVREVLYRGAPERFIHVYGPTENTTFSTFYEVGEVPAGAVSLPIGSPLRDGRVHLLDDWMNLVPVGIKGEIYLGGAGLAHGYPNRPHLTAERFLPNPFSPVPGERLFRTGDLGRLLPDGNIEFRGRRDRQVKLRGFRIELGEIEAHLRAHPSVVEALVWSRPKGNGSGDLAACLVSAADGASTKEISEYLRERLPAYMVPSTIVQVDSLPLTKHGKIDQAALKSLMAEVPEDSARISTAPRTGLERHLVRVWSEVLGRSVGVHDDFFELGGHSLHVTQIVARFKRELGLDVPVRSFFELRTVARLASSQDATAEAMASSKDPGR